MTITVKDYRHGRSEKSSDGYRVEREIVVLADGEDPVGLELRIADLPEVPNIGDSIDTINYPNVLCNSVRPEEIDEGNYANWKVRVTYETSNETPVDPSQDPTDLPAVVSGGSLRRSVALDLAYKDDSEELPTKAIVNSLGDVFDPPVVDEEVFALISIQKNYRNFDLDLISEFENTVNKSSDRVGGVSIAAGEGLINAIRPQSQTDSNGDEYFSVTFEIAISKRGWDKRIVNNGVNKKDPDTEEPTARVPITYADIGGTGDNANEFVTEPQRLREDGSIITDSSEESFILKFKTKRSTNWNTLDIPSDR